MKCSCPKCAAQLEHDLFSVPEKGLNPKCPECDRRYWIYRESFMLRCYHTEGIRHCIHCGEELGVSTFCPGCGTLYPDYCIIQSSKPARRTLEKNRFTFDFSASRPKQSAWQGQSLSSSSDAPAPSGLRRPLVMLAVAILLIAIVAGAATFILNRQAESKYTRNSVIALAGIKAGTEQCLDKGNLLASGTPLSKSDLAELNRIKTEIDQAIANISSTPRKFTAAHDQIVKLNGIYQKLFALCTSNQATADSTAKLAQQFNEQANNLKTTLPAEFREEIKRVAPRYRTLNYMND